MLRDKTRQILKKGHIEGWDKLTDLEQKEALDDLKKNSTKDEDYFRIAFWLPQKIKEAKKNNHKKK